MILRDPNDDSIAYTDTLSCQNNLLLSLSLKIIIIIFIIIHTMYIVVVINSGVIRNS